MLCMATPPPGSPSHLLKCDVNRNLPVWSVVRNCAPSRSGCAPICVSWPSGPSRKLLTDGPPVMNSLFHSVVAKADEAPPLAITKTLRTFLLLDQLPVVLSHR